MPASVIGPTIRALRPKQWMKNVLVFAAPVAAGVINQRDLLIKTLLAFVAFCLASSGTYLINDARDVESDRQHPTKRFRPIAAGELPVNLAWALAAVFVVAGVAIAFATSRNLGLTIVAYLALTTTYSFWLKHQAILDIVAVAGGFVLRAIAGAAATGVPISEWFFIVTSFGALLMVTGKREGELGELGDDAARLRPTLGLYSPGFLAYLRAVFTGVVLVGYCLWAFSSAHTTPDAGQWYQLSILPFAIAILRYALLIDQGKGSEPEQLIVSDRVLLASGAVWAIIYGYAVYVG